MSAWGAVQDRRQIAPGIVSVSTASHGGIVLNAERWREFRAMFPTFEPWAGPMQFEEDCDWAAVALAFPQFFSDQTVYNARRTIAGSKAGEWPGATDYMRELREWLSTPAAATVNARAEAYAASIAGRWEVGSYGTPPAGAPSNAWGVTLYREAEGQKARKHAVFRDMPSQQFYTDAELAEVCHA